MSDKRIDQFDNIGDDLNNQTLFLLFASGDTYNATLGDIRTALSTLTGLTVNGGINVTGTTSVNELIANTISATTYLNLPIDLHTTGLTFNATTYDLNIVRNDGITLTQNLSLLASDMTITGGTYSISTGIATFTNNTGGTFNVSGFLTGMTDTYTTGFTYNDNTLTLKRNVGQPDLNVLINTMTGLTVNGSISATTYINLPTDIRVTGGTYTTGTTTFTNNTGGTFSVSGFNTTISPISVVNVSSLFSTGLASAGVGASGVTYSNFFGRFAGRSATNANSSNFFGNQAGYNAIGANNSNFLGNGAGQYGANANNSNFFGFSAGDSATNAYNSNFMGSEAGSSAVSANDSNFFGSSAGWGAATASKSNFFGQSAGYLADTADNSNFFGTSAGYNAGNAHHSNFMGYFAGYLSTGAFRSNFIGYEAGREATSAVVSNFMGQSAGLGATNAYNSNFIGFQAGNYATNASYSNFLGQNAGNYATGASYSNIFGFNAGNALSQANTIGSNNIIIGTNLSLSARTANAINIGGILFGTGTYSVTTGSPIISATTGGRIGIGVVNPLATLHVSGDALIQGNLTVTGNTQSLFSGNSSVELVKIIQNGSGDAFVVEDIANGDSSHFVINASGNTAIGLVQPLGNDKLTVSGNTSIYGSFNATTISATTYYGLPTDVRVTGGTYSSSTGISTFSNNIGSTFNVSGFFKSADNIYTTGLTFNNTTYDLKVTRNDGTVLTQNLGILASDMTITGGTYNSSTGISTFTNNTGGTFNVSGFLTGMTDTYTTGFTYNDNTLTLKRNVGQPDLNVLINTMTGLTVNGDLTITGTTSINELITNTISATTYYNLPISTDIYITGGTYFNNTFIYTNNIGDEFDILLDAMTGLTINGDLTVAGVTNQIGDFTLKNSNNDNTGSLLFDTSSILTGTTQTIVFPNQSGTLALLSDLPMDEPISKGYYYMENNSIETVCDSNTSFYKVSGVTSTIPGYLKLFTTGSSSNQLVYDFPQATGSTLTYLNYNVSLSVQTPNSGLTLNFQFRKNNTPIPITLTTTTQDSNQPTSVNLTGIVSAQNNDIFELWVNCTTDTSNVLVSDLTVTLFT